MSEQIPFQVAELLFVAGRTPEAEEIAREVERESGLNMQMNHQRAAFRGRAHSHAAFCAIVESAMPDGGDQHFSAPLDPRGGSWHV